MITQVFSMILMIAIGAIGVALIFGMKKAAIKLVVLFGLLCIGFWLLKGCIGDKVNNSPFSTTQQQ